MIIYGKLDCCKHCYKVSDIKEIAAFKIDNKIMVVGVDSDGQPIDLSVFGEISRQHLMANKVVTANLKNGEGIQILCDENYGCNLVE